jgi:DNA polymerase-3 subunit delta'
VPLPPHKKPEEAIELTTTVIEAKREEPFRLAATATNLNIPIDSTREVRQRLARRSDAGVTRVVMIYRMDRMRWSSADALLKLIEEPPPNTVIMLSAEKPDLLPRTIQSRAQKIRLQAVSASMISSYLTTNYEITEKRAALVARICDGSIGRAIEMIAEADEGEAPQRALWLLMFKSLFSDSAAQAISRMTDVIGGRAAGDVAGMLGLWQSLLRDCTGMAVVEDDSAVVNIDFLQELTKLAPFFSDARVSHRITAHIKNALDDMRRNTHIHGTLAALILRIQREIRLVRAA